MAHCIPAKPIFVKLWPKSHSREKDMYIASYKFSESSSAKYDWNVTLTCNPVGLNIFQLRNFSRLISDFTTVNYITSVEWMDWVEMLQLRFRTYLWCRYCESYQIAAERSWLYRYYLTSHKPIPWKCCDFISVTSITSNMHSDHNWKWRLPPFWIFKNSCSFNHHYIVWICGEIDLGLVDVNSAQ